jgi:hypothetical protein
MIFEETPMHIDRVNTESRGIFSWLRTDKESMLKAFDISYRNTEADIKQQFKQIDLDLAWLVFDELSYSEIFKETSGDPELLYDQSTRKRIMTRIMDKWPIIYYLRLLQRNGIMDSVQAVSGEVFFIREAYKPSVNTIFTPDSTLDPS